MKLLRKITFLGLGFLLPFSALAALGGQRSNYVKTEAQSLPELQPWYADSITPPSISSMYDSSTGQNWSSNGDPTVNELTSSTSGFSHSAAMTVTTGKNSLTYYPYIKAQTSSTDDFKAMYVPFRIAFNTEQYRKYTYTLTFQLHAKRATTTGGADYSLEFFYYGETPQTPTGWFYASNDFRASTGYGYSQYRVAGETPNNTGVSYDFTKSFTIENKTGSSVVKYINMGMFCYVESSGQSSAVYTGDIEIKSATLEASNAIATLGGNNYYTVQTAVSAFNAQSGGTMTVLSDLGAYAANPVLTGSGTINLNGHTWDLGTTLMYVRGAVTFDGGTGSKICGSAGHSVLFLDNASSDVTISGSVDVRSNHTDTATTRAILIANGSAKLTLDGSATITSNYFGVQIDDGSFYCQGKINSNNNTYAINVGSSNTSNKNIYLYGQYVQARLINTNNLAKTYIYAAYNSTSYTSSNNVTISIGNSFSVGDVVVRSVTNSNYSKFSLSSVDYQLLKSSTNMIIAHRQYSVTYNLTNLTQTGGPSNVTKQSDLSFTLSADSGYILPANITVSVGSTTLDRNTHFTYNRDTGAVVVYKENFTSYITITASAIQLLTFRFMNTDGEPVHDPIVLSKGSSLTLPVVADLYNVPAYHSTATWFTNPSLTESGLNGGYTVQTVTTSQDYYLRITQTNLDVVNQFVGIQLHFDVDVVSTDNVSDTGACRGETGYYQVAKAAYQSLSSNQKTLFRTNDEFAAARARFTAWAAANHEVINYSTGAFTSASIAMYNTPSKDYTLVIIVASISVLTLIGMFVLNKKKSN